MRRRIVEAIIEGHADLTAAENATWVEELWAKVRETADWVGTKI
jgi:hypothetical protein